MKEREKKQKKFLKEKMTARQNQEAFFFLITQGEVKGKKCLKSI